MDHQLNICASFCGGSKRAESGLPGELIEGAAQPPVVVSGLADESKERFPEPSGQPRERGMGFVGADRRGVLAESFDECLGSGHSPVEPHTLDSVILGFGGDMHTRLSGLGEYGRCASQGNDPVGVVMLGFRRVVPPLEAL
jgi:hypothetical protein